jgi:hypothetical protein
MEGRLAVKVPESVKQGWKGGELGAGAAARARPGKHRRWPAHSKRSNEVLHPMSVCRRMGRKVPRSSSRCAGTTVRANGLSLLIKRS